MSNKNYETGGVPERLRQITIETLPVETPCTLDIESFVEPQEVVYIDKTQAGGMGRLAVDGRQPVKPLEVVDSSDDETVIFTSVWVRNDKGELQQGIVADCRWYNGRFDVVDGTKEIDFTDQEEAWEELDSKQHQVIIAAVVDYDENGDIAVWGDPVFYDAAMYIADVIDRDCIDYSAAKPVKSKNKSKNKKTKKSKKSKG